jgi:hypothetical protein
MPDVTPDLSGMRVTVGSVQPVAPDATPEMSVTEGSPQQISAKIPTGGTRVQKTVVQTNAAGVASWTFPVAFQNPPSIALVCEGGSADMVSAQITSVSATSVSVKVFKQSAVAVALIGLSVQVLAASPGATNVHIYAAPNPS